MNFSDLRRQVNGNGHQFNGGGPFYWVRRKVVFFSCLIRLIYYTQDGLGSGGGTQKPRPMMKCAAFLQSFAESDQVLSD